MDPYDDISITWDVYNETAWGRLKIWTEISSSYKINQMQTIRLVYF
jgi:hypothetical protein